MEITWPVGLVLLGLIAAFCFALWLLWRREMEKQHHHFQTRAFSLEEKKFDVWRTLNMAQAAQLGTESKKIVQQALRSTGSLADIEPNPGKVVSMFDRKRERPAISIETASGRVNEMEEPSEERILEICELLQQAKRMSPEEAVEFLKQNGIEDAVVFKNDDPPPVS
jgi:hypothetical protein